MKKFDWKKMTFKQFLMVIYDIAAVNAAYMLTHLMVLDDFSKTDLDVYGQRTLPVTNGTSL